MADSWLGEYVGITYAVDLADLTAGRFLDRGPGKSILIDAKDLAKVADRDRVKR